MPANLNRDTRQAVGAAVWNSLASQCSKSVTPRFSEKTIVLRGSILHTPKQKQTLQDGGIVAFFLLLEFVLFCFSDTGFLCVALASNLSYKGVSVSIE